MKSNLTLFGPVHSGKSTLAGLMYTHKMCSDELERLDQKIMNELGEEYDHAQRIAYYVDKSMDERKRKPEKSSIGTSKHLHYQTINIKNEGNILLIDSPGANRHWKQNFRSSFLADIGILVYSISAFHKLFQMERDSSSYQREAAKLFAQIELWKNYKNLDYLILALSKMDGESTENQISEAYGRILYVKAVQLITSEPLLKNVPIVPIAIEVNNRVEHNIYTKSPCMSWYQGKTLMEVIADKVKQFQRYDSSDSYTFASVIEKLRIKETQEPVFRIKVLSGKIQKRDTLYITQITHNNIPEYKIGEVTVKSLKLDEGTHEDAFVKNAIGGVTLSKIKVDGKFINAENIGLSRVSFLIGGDLKIKIGNLLCLKVDYCKEKFYNFNIGDKINILMFGKIFSAMLFGKRMENDCFYIYTYAKNYPLALPVQNNGKIIFPNYVIERDNIEFTRVKLKNIEMLEKESNLLLQTHIAQEYTIYEKESIFEELSVSEEKNDTYNLNLTLDNIELLSSKLRKGFRKHHISEFSMKLINLENNEII